MLTEAAPRQSFQDDMESLLYVVLYSALLYQPHNLSQAALSIMLREMFDDTPTGPNNTFVRGGGKIRNAISRAYTGNIKFGSTALQQWLETVMDLHQPPKLQGRENQSSWCDAQQLDMFWSTFLAQWVLPTDNRVVHDLHIATGHQHSPPARVVTEDSSLLVVPSTLGQPVAMVLEPPRRRSARLLEKERAGQTEDATAVGTTTANASGPRRGPMRRAKQKTIRN